MKVFIITKDYPMFGICRSALGSAHETHLVKNRQALDQAIAHHGNPGLLLLDCVLYPDTTDLLQAVEELTRPGKFRVMLLTKGKHQEFYQMLQQRFRVSYLPRRSALEKILYEVNQLLLKPIAVWH